MVRQMNIWKRVTRFTPPQLTWTSLSSCSKTNYWIQTYVYDLYYEHPDQFVGLEFPSLFPQTLLTVLSDDSSSHYKSNRISGNYGLDLTAIWIASVSISLCVLVAISKQRRDYKLLQVHGESYQKRNKIFDEIIHQLYTLWMGFDCVSKTKHHLLH